MMEQEALLLEAQGRSAEADKKRREILDKQRAAEYERLMKVNPELARLTAELWALEDATEAARRAAARRQEQEDTARKLFDILTRAVEAEKATLNAQKSIIESTINTLKNIFDILKKNVEDLYGEVDSTILTQANQGRAVISGAISSGVLPDSTLLSDSIEAVRREITTTAYLSKADATKARLIFAAQLELLKGTTEEQLTDAEKQLKALNRQIDYLDQVLKTAKDQLDAYLGNTEVLKTVSEALTDLSAFLQKPKDNGTGSKPTGTGSGGGSGGGANSGGGGGPGGGGGVIIEWFVS
jgi:archaellum component FlaC